MNVFPNLNMYPFRNCASHSMKGLFYYSAPIFESMHQGFLILLISVYFKQFLQYFSISMFPQILFQYMYFLVKLLVLFSYNSFSRKSVHLKALFCICFFMKTYPNELLKFIRNHRC